MLRGDLGQPPGGWPAALQKKALKGAEPITDRPGFAAGARRSRSRARRRGRGRPATTSTTRRSPPTSCIRRSMPISPARQDTYGPVSVLPTQVFFYGLPAGRGDSGRESKRARRWSSARRSIGETDEEGLVRVFFELNGQPRMVKVPDRAHGAGGSAATRRKAEEGNPNHVARAHAGRRFDTRRRAPARRSRPAIFCCPSRR